MTWRITQRPHQVFARNPLATVIFEVRYAPILRVPNDVAHFQDRIRERFPGYQEVEMQTVELSPEGVQLRNTKSFRFQAPSGLTIASLADHAVSLEYQAHRSRAELLSDAQYLVEALEHTYRPVTPIRIGLRYVNLLDRAAISRDLGREVAWEDLVASEFLRIPRDLADLEGTRFGGEVGSPMTVGMLTLRYGLLPLPGADGLRFRFDVDRFVENPVTTDEICDTLSLFADDIFNLFLEVRGPALVNWMDQQ